jgi:hypothetical protein
VWGGGGMRGEGCCLLPLSRGVCCSSEYRGTFPLRPARLAVRGVGCGMWGAGCGVAWGTPPLTTCPFNRGLRHAMMGPRQSPRPRQPPTRLPSCAACRPCPCPPLQLGAVQGRRHSGDAAGVRPHSRGRRGLPQGPVRRDRQAGGVCGGRHFPVLQAAQHGPRHRHRVPGVHHHRRRGLGVVPAGMPPGGLYRVGCVACCDFQLCKSAATVCLLDCLLCCLLRLSAATACWTACCDCLLLRLSAVLACCAVCWAACCAACCAASCVGLLCLRPRGRGLAWFSLALWYMSSRPGPLPPVCPLAAPLLPRRARRALRGPATSACGCPLRPTSAWPVPLGESCAAARPPVK